MAKTLLAAGVLCDFEFGNHEELELYLYWLDQRQINYKVIETFERPDGIVLVRILQHYNSVDLIEL